MQDLNLQIDPDYLFTVGGGIVPDVETLPAQGEASGLAFTASSGSGFSVSITSSGGTSYTTSLTVTSASTARTSLGLGGLAVLSAGAASADTAPTQGAAYVQADVNAIITELRDLKAKLRTAGIIAT